MLTAYVTTKEDATGTLFLWKDGDGLAALPSGEKKVLFSDFYGGAAKPGTNVLLRTGGNGLAVVGLREPGADIYSAYMVADAAEVGNSSTAAEGAAAADVAVGAAAEADGAATADGAGGAAAKADGAVSGTSVNTYVIDCLGGAIPGTILRFADASKCFAAIEEDGVLRIYDVGAGSTGLPGQAQAQVTGQTQSSGQAQVTGQTQSSGQAQAAGQTQGTGQTQSSMRLEITDPEKFSGAVSMAFADHDRYLCLLSYNGDFRIYDTVNGECVIRELNSLFATEYGTTELYTSLTADGSKLIVRATETEQEQRSNAALYSLDRFEHLADIPDMIGYSEKTNKLILIRKNYAAKEYYTCPLYSAQELVDWQ